VKAKTKGNETPEYFQAPYAGGGAEGDPLKKQREKAFGVTTQSNLSNKTNSVADRRSKMKDQQT